MRFRRFAGLLARILAELGEHDLLSQLAFAEIFNEADGLPFVGGYDNVLNYPAAERRRFREEHEEALAELGRRYPVLTFAYSSATPFTDPELMPRNAALWNFHPYYCWPVYDLLERGWVSQKPGCGTPDARFVYVEQPFDAVRNSRAGRRKAAEDRYRRVWLYANLRPERLPELDALLEQELAENENFYRGRADEALARALDLRRRYLPGAQLAMTEGATYCGAEVLGWEERSATYWRLVNRMAEHFARSGGIAWAPRTNSGCDDPGWQAAEQLREANRIFLETPSDQLPENG